MVAQSSAKPAPRAATDAPPVPSVAQPRERPTRPIEDLLEEEALRALAPLMCDLDREKYRMILTSELSAAEKVALWKWRREHAAALK
jgi:hypothetical protein